MKILQGIFLVLLALILSVVTLLTASGFKWANELPSLQGLDALSYSATSQIYARDGVTPIGQIVPVVGEDRAGTNRIPVGLDEISPAALEAIVAYEDDQFFNHYGFDIPGLLKATYAEFLGEADRGGSTITTQVVKNTVLEDIRNERSLERKAKEFMLAIELERRLTKAEILQRYVNIVFWGGNVYGIRAAAQAYFGKDPIQLTLAEGLYLARLIPSPNSRHEDFIGTRQSMRQVLDKMVEQGIISQDAATRAWLENLQPKGWNVTYDNQGNVISAEATGERLLAQTSISSDLSKHVVWAVRNWLTEKYGEDVVFGTGGLRVYTTIDVKAQKAANDASLRATTEGNAPPDTQLAIVGLDPATGEILAMVGERLEPGKSPSEFNRVLQAERQPGSSFKPVVYASAFELGSLSQASIMVDEPAVFKQRGLPDYEPNNWDMGFIGAKTVREHVDQSRNIPAIKALEAATPEEVAARATELGYTNVNPYFSLGLGAFETTPLQHAAAFAAFANNGVKMDPYFIQRVEDSEGNVLYEAAPREVRVWSPETAYIVLDMLHGNVTDRNPTALSWRANIEGRWVAGKTGTTNLVGGADKDIWFVGATPGLVAAVWIGNDDSSPLPKYYTLPNGERETTTSSRQPVYVWKDFVENALRGVPANGEGFPVPDGIVFRTVDRSTGAESSSGTRMAFTAGTEIRAGRQSIGRIEVPIDTRTNKRATASTPREFIQYRQVTPENVAPYLTN